MWQFVSENRTMKRLVLTAAALLAGAGVASAQSGSLYTSGSVQYDYLTSNGSDLSFAYADFALGFGFGGVSSLPMGFELGVLGIAADGGGPVSSEIALFPTFWVDTSVGRFSAGVPRSAFGSAIQLPRMGGSKYASLLFAPALNMTDFLPLIGNINSYGLRFDGAIGSLDAGLSVHGFTDTGSDATSVTGFIGRDYGALDFVVGFESISSSGSSQQTYAAQIGYDVGLYGARLTLADTSLSSDMLALVDAFYRPIDWLTLNASYATVGGSNDFYGINAEASFLKNGYAGIGYLSDFGGSDGITSVYVGWKLNY